MRKIELELDEVSKVNKVYILVSYFGGDADTEHPEEHQLPIFYNEVDDNRELIEKEYDKYKKLQGILDINHPDFCENYNDCKEKHGKEFADLMDGEVPRDPQNDFDTYCSIDSIVLVAYDKEGNRYEAYL
jgi:hypothetical protein